MDKVRIGILGCGQIAQHHMRTYKGIPEVEMVACADVSEEVAKKSAEEFGIPTALTSVKELLAMDLDAIDVCLHNNLHMPATIAALEAGKHVYCEKPMAGSFTDAERMLNTAKEKGKKLHIQLANLYSNECRAAKELIELGELGEVFHARSTGHRRRGRPYVDGYGTPSFVQKKHASGGALYDMGVYHISQMLYLLGNPDVSRISGQTYQKMEMDARRREISNYDVEELGLGFVKFDGGVSLDIIEAWAVNMGDFEGSSVIGSKGGIRLNPFSFHRSIGNIDIDGTANLGSANYRWHNVGVDGHFYGESQQHWAAVLQGKVEPIPTAEIALNTMLISEGIYLSSKLGREVTPQEVRENSVSTAISL